MSSPRGNMMTFWKSSGQYLSSVDVGDGGGVAPGARPFEFLVSSGTGTVATFDARSTSQPQLRAKFVIPDSWDNHLIAAR